MKHCIHTVNKSTGILWRSLNGTLAILSARCVTSMESNILHSSCSTPQFFSEENSKWPAPRKNRKKDLNTYYTTINISYNY